MPEVWIWHSILLKRILQSIHIKRRIVSNYYLILKVSLR